MRTFLVTVNGSSYEVTVEEAGGTAPVAAPDAAPASEPAQAAPQAPIAGGEKVTSPMPGAILDVKVQAGQQVRNGDLLVILEAMKMENEILAPVDGKVLQVAVSKGTSVNTDDVLVVIG